MKILIVYLDNSLNLWGIPYRMKSDCGQQPSDLEHRIDRGWKLVDPDLFPADEVPKYAGEWTELDSPLEVGPAAFATRPLLKIKTFRAAYYRALDGQSEVRLTEESDSGLEKDVLICKAEVLAKSIGLEYGAGDIIVGEWTE